MGRRITDLTPQKRNPQRVNVYLDGEFAFGLARIVAAWLQVGQELSDEKLAALQADDEREAAYQQAIRFINYRPRTQTEIRQNLIRHAVRSETADYVLERLSKSGLVNDASFARNWVENRSDLRPRSRRALTYELSQHGIDPQTIAATVESVDDDEMAYQAALKRARKLEQLDWAEFRQKMLSYLSQRGFNYETSSQAAARVWENLHANQTE